MKKTILILAANPRKTPRLRLDTELHEIEQGLQRSKQHDNFLLKLQWATRPQDIRRAMLDFSPNIVHFCGHGEGEAGIVFQNESEEPQIIATETLSRFFELFRDTVECVVLNACYSEIQARAIAQHIPYVIGMNYTIGDKAAIEFAVAFYDAIGAGKEVEFAYKLACSAIEMAGISGHLIPQLITQAQSSVQKKPLQPQKISSPSLDESILQILYTYQQEHPGDPKMNMQDILMSCNSSLQELIRMLYQLQEKKWVDFELTEQAGSGQVWLTSAGRKVAKDIQKQER